MIIATTKFRRDFVKMIKTNENVGRMNGIGTVRSIGADTAMKPD
jgi:hypothetical protein